MPFSAVLVTAVTFAASSSKSTSTSAGLIGYLPILVIVAAFYLLLIRPRSRQAQQQRQLLADVGPGDEVLTGAGIFGTVLDIEGDRVTIETAPGTRLTVVRSTISRRIEPTTVADVVDADIDDEHGWDDEHDEEGDLPDEEHDGLDEGDGLDDEHDGVGGSAEQPEGGGGGGGNRR